MYSKPKASCLLVLDDQRPLLVKHCIMFPVTLQILQQYTDLCMFISIIINKPCTCTPELEITSALLLFQLIGGV